MVELTISCCSPPFETDPSNIITACLGPLLFELRPGRAFSSRCAGAVAGRGVLGEVGREVGPLVGSL